MTAAGPLRVLLAPNAFKGTLSALEVCSAMAAGVRRALPEARLTCLPLADGGDGFLATLVAAGGGRTTRHRVVGPLLEPIWARIGWLEARAGEAAVIELASTAGIALVDGPDPQTAATASTRGLGQLIRASLRCAPAEVLVGLGGSASTDGGAGMARALGYRFLMSDGREIPEGGLGLRRLHRIEFDRVDPRLSRVRVLAVCDVTIPLLGRRGSAAVYGAQKGADRRTVAGLEAGLRRLAEVAGRDLGSSGLEAKPGSGAAGGTGFGLLAFCRARVAPGVDLVANACGLDGELARADLVLTGEGRFDLESLHGKVPGEVVRRARRAGVACVVIAGSSEPGGAEALKRLGSQLLEIGGDISGLTPADRHTRALIRRRSRVALGLAAVRACTLVRPPAPAGRGR